MALRPDATAFFSNLPNYINIGKKSGNIGIAGSVAANGVNNYNVVIPTLTNSTRLDIYGTNLNNGDRQLLSSSNGITNDSGSSIGGIYQHVSTEFVQLSVSIVNQPAQVTVTITINNNTAGTITLISQTIQVDVWMYAIPF